MSHEAKLPSIQDLMDNTVVIITDNEDGTWTATGPNHLIYEQTFFDDPYNPQFTIEGAIIIYEDIYTYTIASSTDE